MPVRPAGIDHDLGQARLSEPSMNILQRIDRFITTDPALRQLALLVGLVVAAYLLLLLTIKAPVVTAGLVLAYVILRRSNR